MQLRTRTKAEGLPKNMKVILFLMLLACLECITADPLSGARLEVQKYKKADGAVSRLDSKHPPVAKGSDRSSQSESTKVQKRKSRALTQFLYLDANKYKEGDNGEESKLDAQLDTKSVYIIPHMRPGRTPQESNGYKPQDHYFSNGYKLEIFNKRDSDTMIPMLRYGKSESSLLQVPKYGKSAQDNHELLSFNNDLNGNLDGLSYDDIDIDTLKPNYFEIEMHSNPLGSNFEQDKSTLKRGANQRLIPYPRIGRDDGTRNDQEFNNGVITRQTNDSLIPQIRYGRDSIKSKMAKSEKPPYFILPNMRPGRSFKSILNQKEKNTSPNLRLVPYPRPGRADRNYEGGSQYNSHLEKLINAMYSASHQMNGDSDEGQIDSRNLKQGILILSENNNLEKLKLLKELKKELLNSEPDSSTFVIPYPRPGKRNLKKYENKMMSQNQDDDRSYLFKTKDQAKTFSDYVLPYPRPGKKNGKNPTKSELISSEKEQKESTIDFVKGLLGSENSFQKRLPESLKSMYAVPFPDKLENINAFIKNSNYRNSYSFLPHPALSQNSKINNETDYILPYSDLKRGQSSNILPYPRLGRSSLNANEGYVLPQLRFGKAITVLPYSSSKRSDSILPYPRLGRSESILPYPRLGRSDAILPYPRLGRSDSLLPYPRLGRSNSILPYPRLGRSDSIVPYPRLGRSDSILPYPRPGRSDSILPYPRLGRSDSILPYPRPGRSDSILPYPRLGRSDSILPYPRLGRSDSILPYPRLGRSDSILPYPRPGRSGSLLPYPRIGRSDSILPYPRLGRSDSLLPYPRLGRSDSILPYPRLGRSDSILPYPRLGRSEYTLPYPRPGRSNSLLPIPRLGRSNDSKNVILTYSKLVKSKPFFELIYSNKENTDSFTDSEEADNGDENSESVAEHPKDSQSKEHPNLSGVPNPSKKLNERILAGDSVYLLPYPRPGRSD